MNHFEDVDHTSCVLYCAELESKIDELRAIVQRSEDARMKLVEDLVLIAAEMGLQPNELGTTQAVARARELLLKEALFADVTKTANEPSPQNPTDVDGEPSEF